MKKQDTPLLSIVLYVLSGLNFIVMLICVFTTINAEITIQSDTLFFQANLGTLGVIFLGYLVQAIRGISFIFILGNVGISVLLLTGARMVKNTKKHSFHVQILENKLEIASAE